MPDEPLLAMRSRIVWSSSTSMSSVIVTARFWVRLPVAVNVTDFVAIRKSPGAWALWYSVAVPPVRTSTVTVVEACGRRLTWMGTFSTPPDTSSATLRVYAVVRPDVPNPMRALSSSSSVTVTVAAVSPDVPAQPDTEVDSVTVNVSSPSTRESLLVGTRSVAVVAPEDTVTDDGGEAPRSAADPADVPE